MKKHYLIRLTVNIEVYKTYLSDLPAYKIDEQNGLVYIMPKIAVNTYKKFYDLITRMLHKELFDLSYQTTINRMKSDPNMRISLPGIKIDFEELLPSTSDINDRSIFL